MIELKKVSSLSSSDLLLVREEATKVKYGDLYCCLHMVGDDPIKAEIEENLRSFLDEKTFRNVVALFRLSTGHK